jgi:HAD superfamily hydrolase (TIGR01450 family)
MITPATESPASRDLEERLAAVEGVVFDIDGCLVLSDKPGGHGGHVLPGAVEAFAKVRASGRKIVVFTNASSQVPADIAAGLTQLGFPVVEHDVLTPSVIAAEVALERFGTSPVLAFGGPGLHDVLEAGGVVLADEDHPLEAAAVIIGWDVGFTRDRLQAAAEAIWNGAPLLVTSDARRFASATKPMAGVGGFIAQGLAYVTDCTYEVLGKPSKAAMDVATRRLGVVAEQTLIAGDDLTLEVAMAKNAGAIGVLVTTGVHDLDDADLLDAENAPDLVVHGLLELAEHLARADANANADAHPRRSGT